MRCCVSRGGRGRFKMALVNSVIASFLLWAAGYSAEIDDRSGLKSHSIVEQQIEQVTSTQETETLNPGDRTGEDINWQIISSGGATDHATCGYSLIRRKLTVAFHHRHDDSSYPRFNFTDLFQSYIK
jgi:hypothetical protein